MLFPVSCCEKETTFKINNRALARFAEELAGNVLCCSLEISGNATKLLCSLGIAFTGLEMAAECPARVVYFLVLTQVTAFDRREL